VRSHPKTQAAKKEKAYFDSKPRIIRGFLYNGACLWSTAKGLGDGAEAMGKEIARSRLQLRNLGLKTWLKISKRKMKA